MRVAVRPDRAPEAPEPQVIVDWRTLRVVVLESDDWGLCAWVPDEEAYRALAGTPAWRHPRAGGYRRSTLENAGDVARLCATLREFRGADGRPPVWQANTVLASPDYGRLRAPDFSCGELPLVFYPDFPSRWRRPGLWEEVERARAAAVWWPELHGLVHLPQAAWLAALRAGAEDALRAHAEQCFVCEAVEAAAEYDPTEPPELRRRTVARAVAAFRERFGRLPGSLCAPDYRWDDVLEADAEALGVTTLQGDSERVGRRFRRLHHALARVRWRARRGRRFYLPARTAFEPRGDARPGSRLGALAAHRAARAAWRRGRPAVISSHRLNYAHLDPAWAEAGNRALRDLLAALVRDGARFLTDSEVREIHERGWSARTLGPRTSLVRCYGEPETPVRIPVPPGTTGATLGTAHRGPNARLTIEGDGAAGRLAPGEYLIEWSVS